MKNTSCEAAATKTWLKRIILESIRKLANANGIFSDQYFNYLELYVHKLLDNSMIQYVYYKESLFFVI
jgi:hypothetical protein